MKCEKCEQEFNAALASCGTGSTWSLYKCPHCEQLQADGGIIPQAVIDDGDIIVRNVR